MTEGSNPLRVLVVLRDRQLQRLLEPGLGLGFAAEADECLAEQDARHHPVGLLVCAELQVLDCVDRPVLGQQRLGETEAEELVVGLLGNERGELSGAGHVS